MKAIILVIAMYSLSNNQQNHCEAGVIYVVELPVHQNLNQNRNVVNAALESLVEKLKQLLHRWGHVIVIREIELKEIDNRL